MSRTLILVVVLIAALTTPAESAPGDTAAYCQQESRGSYASEAYCVKREREAYDRIAARGRIEQRIMDHCNAESTTWSALDYCIRREEEARARLGR